ncbi:uncharacterized protein LOC126890925 [Diabrotica virgifera virgifera]|uniref:CCHC-type domain-containing protein n=1 Tax=Diabrotica virgifera virgifera TaxID=50390 RepID=A0ABM5L0T9_DIAVI|nr:uncharacterized protein LOC126890925 [Diabrotica virgifera virgifera]
MADDQIKSLKSQRANLKGQITRFSNYLTSNKDKLDQYELMARLEKVEETLSKFDICQSALESLVDNEDHNSERDSFESAYYAAVSKARSILGGSIASGSHLSSESSQMSDPIVNIKLPPLSLVQFDGNLEKFMQFYDSFNNIIHTNKNLSAIQKFYYLSSSLKGEALQTIQSLQVSDANYSVAWDLICQRYKNSRLIINSHIKALFEIPSLNKESREDLRNLLDTLQKNIRALENLKQSVKEWDSIIIFLVSSKLDNKTRKEWELSLSDVTTLPSYEEFIKFLSTRCQALEMLEFKSDTTNESSREVRKSKNRSYTHVSQQNNKICSFCKGSHLIYYCQGLLKLTVDNRIKEIRKLRLCTKCLRAGHANKDCRSEDCRKCNRNHNTLLHLEKSTNQNNPSTSTEVGEETSSDRQVNLFSSSLENKDELYFPTNETVLASSDSSSYILLSTANIYIQDKSGCFVKCRALLDSASQSNYMTYNCLTKLGLNKSNVDISTSGISKKLIRINHSTKAKIYSMNKSFHADLSFLALEKITDNLPGISFNREAINFPKNIQLADTDFNQSKPIEVLLGASIFWSLMCVGQIKCGKNMPVLQKTHLGWILSGPISLLNSCNNICNLNIKNLDIQEKLEKFWKLEECPTTTRLSQEELECEEHFKQTTSRGSDGKFIQYPEESRIILRDFYVDDLITGASTIEEAQKFKCNISAMLSDAGFILRKWASNDQKILEGDNDINLPQYFITDDKTVKTLGLIWDSNNDELGYSRQFNGGGMFSSMNKEVKAGNDAKYL